jgi:hypothetical protein
LRGSVVIETSGTFPAAPPTAIAIYLLSSLLKPAGRLSESDRIRLGKERFRTMQF